MIKTYERFTDEEVKKILAELERNKNKPSFKIGDIVDLDYGHIARDARLFAKVIKVFKPGGVATVRSIICHRVPYLCDHEFETIIDAFDLKKLADMKVFNEKMKEKEDMSLKNNNPNDPYNEEDWNDNYYMDFEPWELDQANIHDRVRYITVMVFDKDTAGNYIGRLVFINDPVEMERRLDELIKETGFRKCYIECESDYEFTEDEKEMLKGIDMDLI